MAAAIGLGGVLAVGLVVGLGIGIYEFVKGDDKKAVPDKGKGGTGTDVLSADECESLFESLPDPFYTLVFGDSSTGVPAPDMTDPIVINAIAQQLDNAPPSVGGPFHQEADCLRNYRNAIIEHAKTKPTKTLGCDTLLNSSGLPLTAVAAIRSALSSASATPDKLHDLATSVRSTNPDLADCIDSVADSK